MLGAAAITQCSQCVKRLSHYDLQQSDFNATLAFFVDQYRLNHVRQHIGGNLHQTVSAEEEDLSSELQGEVVHSYPGKNSLL